MKLASSVTMAPAIILPRANLRIRSCVARACAITQLRAARLSLTERGAVATFLQKYKNRFSSFFEEMEIFRKQLPPGKRAFSLFLSLRGNLLSQKLYFGGYEREGGACMKALQNLGKWQD